MDLAGVEGGFTASDQPKFTDHLSIVLIPDFVELPYPNIELPELVRTLQVQRVVRYVPHLRGPRGNKLESGFWCMC